VLRVCLERCDGGWLARSAGHQGAGILSTSARCDGLLLVPDDVERQEAGTTVSVRLLSGLVT
jgi:molybdopterin biosynthesis enzyme